MSSLDNLKKEAKRWLKALRDGDAAARARLRAAWPAAPDVPVLRDVQHALAREHEFDDWKALTKALEQARTPGDTLTPLDRAVLAAIVNRQQDELRRLASAHPELLSDTQAWQRLITHAIRHQPAPVLSHLLEIDLHAHGGLTSVNSELAAGSRWTALHEAASMGRVEAIRVLLKHGADARVRDAQCATAAAVARRAGHAAAADAILESGNTDIFEAVDADRADLVARIADRDPAAIERPFGAYAACAADRSDDASRPSPATTPLQWAESRGKERARQALVERGAGARTAADLERAERAVVFLQSACWDHHTHGKGDHRMLDRAAQRLLAHDPAMASASLYTAIVAGEIETVRRLVAERPELAREPGGPRGWTPILYLAYTRFSHAPTIANAIDIARALLDAGAGPNDFYMAGDARYSVLTGVAGEGEQDSPRQPYAHELYRLLLERGAGPYDIQVLYDTHFSTDMIWWLDLTYDITVARGMKADWDDPAWTMLDMGGYGPGSYFVIDRATRKNNVALVAWALAHGADPNVVRSAHPKFHPKRSLYDSAMLQGRTEIAALLARHGAHAAAAVEATPEERLSAACLGLDRAAAAALLASHPELARSTRAVFDAARDNRVDALRLIEELGLPLDAADHTNARALHQAAVNGSTEAIQFLIDRGVEVDPRETAFGGPPIGWAAHGDQQDAIELLRRYSRDIWTLTFQGYVDRVGELLADDPALARDVRTDGGTPLWWLPDDEDKALALVDLLIAAGADPAVTNKSGRTAADWARRRGMLDVARRLESR